MTHSPVYLRDLKKEVQEGFIEEIKNDPKLNAAYEAEEDIQIGFFLNKPRLV